MSAAALSEYTVHLRPDDNIAVVTRPIPAGTQLDGLAVTSRVGMGHKLALRPIKKGEAVYKYGQIIGFASKDIAPGDWVHVHNVAADAFERDYAFCRDCPPRTLASETRYFEGYDRGTDRVEPFRYGTRNYIAVVSTVNCSAHTSKYITQRFNSTDLLKKFPNVDGVIAITHKAEVARCSTTTGPTIASSTARSPASRGTPTSPRTSSSASVARPARRCTSSTANN